MGTAVIRGNPAMGTDVTVLPRYWRQTRRWYYSNGDSALPYSRGKGDDDSVDDIASYWKQKRNYPKLVNVAKRVLCVPATSTSSERSFSVAGWTLEERRTRLSSESVDGLLYLHGLMRRWTQTCPSLTFSVCTAVHCFWKNRWFRWFLFSDASGVSVYEMTFELRREWETGDGDIGMGAAGMGRAWGQL